MLRLPFLCRHHKTLQDVDVEAAPALNALNEFTNVRPTLIATRVPDAL